MLSCEECSYSFRRKEEERRRERRKGGRREGRRRKKRKRRERRHGRDEMYGDESEREDIVDRVIE